MRQLKTAQVAERPSLMYLKEILLDLRARHRPYLQGQVLVRMVDAHTKGWQNWTREIHRVLSLELLQRQLIERW